MGDGDIYLEWKMTKLVLRIRGKLPGKSHSYNIFFSQFCVEQSEGEAIEGALTSYLNKPLLQTHFSEQIHLSMPLHFKLCDGEEV